MRRIALITTAVLMLLSAAHSFAQNEDGALSISLKSAQDYAVEHNKTLKNSSLDIRKAEAAKWGAIASMLPQVSASLGYSNYCGYEMNLGPMSMSMPATGTLGITASIALTGQQIIGIQMAEMSKTLADITTQQSEDEIRYQVAKIYSEMVSPGVSSMKSGALAALFKASSRCAQSSSFILTFPFLFAEPNPVSVPMRRSTSSMSVISRVKNAVGIPWSTAALRAMFRAIAVLPCPGRAPMTMRFPSCQPMVMASRDGNPDGTPVNPVDCCDRCIRSNALFSASPSST